MPQYQIEHPDNPRLYARYGWDRALDFFVDVTEDAHTIYEYDRRFEGYDYVAGALQALVSYGFFGNNDIFEAQSKLPVLTPAEIEEPSVRRCAEVITALRRSAE